MNRRRSSLTARAIGILVASTFIVLPPGVCPFCLLGIPMPGTVSKAKAAEPAGCCSRCKAPATEEKPTPTPDHEKSGCGGKCDNCICPGCRNLPFADSSFSISLDCVVTFDAPSAAALTPATVEGPGVFHPPRF